MWITAHYFFPLCNLSLTTSATSFISSMKFDINFSETPIEFLFKLIFSWTYAHYSSFILFIYTCYLFVYTEASVRRFYFEKSEENSCGGFSFLIKLQTPAHVLSCEFCEININFVEKLRTATSEHRIYIVLISLLILRQNIYLQLNSDHLLGKQRTMLRYRSQPSKISYLRFGNVFFIF